MPGPRRPLAASATAHAQMLATLERGSLTEIRSHNAFVRLNTTVYSNYLLKINSPMVMALLFWLNRLAKYGQELSL